MLQNAWNSSMSGRGTWDDISGKLDKCQRETYKWREGKGGSTKKSITQLQQRLNLVQGSDMNVGGKEKLLKQELNGLLDQEDLRSKQRAKVDWLKNGDRNTKFYYACANQQRKLNQILKIENE